MKSKRSEADYREQIGILMSLAQEMPHGPPKSALLDECIRIADAQNDDSYGFYLRMDLMESATFGGQPELMLTAFGWCLAAADRNPDDYDLANLMWRYKWAVTQGEHFPNIPLAKLDAMLDDLKTRFAALGCNDHAYWQTRRQCLRDTGRLKEALAADKQAEKLDRDFLSDCVACDINARVELYLECGDLVEARQIAKPLFNGHHRCAEVPATTYAALLMPLAESGEWNEAMRLHELNYSSVRRNPGLLGSLCGHLAFLVVTDNLDDARKGLDHLLATGLSYADPLTRFHVYQVAALYCSRRSDAGESSIKLKLPKEIPPHQAKNAYDPKKLVDWFDGQARDLAAVFDRRNGNKAFAKHRKSRLSWRKMVRPMTLTKTPRKNPG